jgi:hypothetical protein
MFKKIADNRDQGSLAVQFRKKRFAFFLSFYQFLSISIRVWLLRIINLGWMPKTPDPSKARETVMSIRLLAKRDFQSLFPEARLYEEKIYGMTKSFVAYGGWGD